MIEKLKALFSGDADAGAAETGEERVRLAAAVLLVEAARLDDEYGDDERLAIARLLRERFGLSEDETEELLTAAEAAQDHAVEVFTFTRDIKDTFSHEERIEIIEMLWEVAYADGELHKYEDQLVRRVAGLLHVTDRERGEARKRALAKLGLSD